MRKIIIILDGAADRGDKTSLATANIPNLDILARNSLCGMMYPVKGIAPESGEAQFSILGYNLKDYPGRGPVEALANNIRLKKGEIALRINFVRIKGNKILDPRMPIPYKHLKKINKIDKDIKIIPTIGYRGIMIVKNASPNITNTHPGYKEYKNISQAIPSVHKLKRCKGDKKTSEKINNFIDELKKVLKNKGCIIIRGAGNKQSKLKPLNGWSLIADMPVEIGLARLFKMKILKRKKDEINQVINEKNNIYVQIKAPDHYGHIGDFKGKVKALEKIDKTLKPLLNLKDTVICITADHATPYSLKRHSSDPVPFLLYGKNARTNIKGFSEKECRKTGIVIEGKDLMKLIYS